MILRLGAVSADVRVRFFDGRENRAEVDAVGFPVVDGFLHLERVHATDHFVDGSEAQRGHNLACFLGNHKQIVDDVLGIAGEFFAQLRILRGDADGAGVEVALAHHNAAHRDERRSGETHFLRAEQRGDNHVTAGLETAVGLQHHAAAKIVEYQRLVRLGNAKFPRQAGVLDAGERRRASAAGCAGNQNVIRVRLGHARGDGAHAHLGHELHTHTRGAVGVFEVVNELRQILDGINIVMRRRTDQAHAGSGVANARNGFIHLAPGQLAAFTGLCALGNFDLQLIGVGEVPYVHPEPPRGHLLDGRALGIAVG